jgi:hypothetical protein
VKGLEGVKKETWRVNLGDGVKEMIDNKVKMIDE